MMSKRYIDNKFTRTCERADKTLNILSKPIKTLAKITIHLSVILGIIIFIVSPSNDKSILITSLIINFGLECLNKRKDQNVIKHTLP
jgi:hypothetical protein